jgi:hypothetical protein
MFSGLKGVKTYLRNTMFEVSSLLWLIIIEAYSFILFENQNNYWYLLFILGSIKSFNHDNCS